MRNFKLLIPKIFYCEITHKKDALEIVRTHPVVFQVVPVVFQVVLFFSTAFTNASRSIRARSLAPLASHLSTGSFI